MKPALFSLSILLTSPVWANTQLIDQTHENIAQQVDQTAENINQWFGETNSNQNASATLRVLVDTHWNQDDGISLKPRIRGRIKLPVLEEKISVVFGDDDLDTENSQHASTASYAHNQNKTFDYEQSKDENASLALRWSQISERFNIKTDADIGVRSGSDVYLRFLAEKEWQHTEQLYSHFEQTYRYGIKSKHHLRSEYEWLYQEANNRAITHEIGLSFDTDDGENNWTWDNHLTQQHHFSGSRSLNYGLYAAGGLNHEQPKLNSYGPFISYRQPIWRHWLFLQTELNYFNNKKENQSHRIGALLRIEALF